MTPWRRPSGPLGWATGWPELSAHNFLGRTLLPAASDWTAALDHAERALALADRLGIKSYAAAARAALGQALAALGQHARAERMLDQAYALILQSSAASYWPVVLGSLAVAASARNKRRWALNEGEALLRKTHSGNRLAFYQQAIDAALRNEDWR